MKYSVLGLGSQPAHLLTRRTKGALYSIYRKLSVRVNLVVIYKYVT